MRGVLRERPIRDPDVHPGALGRPQFHRETAGGARLRRPSRGPARRLRLRYEVRGQLGAVRRAAGARQRPTGQAGQHPAGGNADGPVPGKRRHQGPLGRHRRRRHRRPGSGGADGLWRLRWRAAVPDQHDGAHPRRELPTRRRPAGQSRRLHQYAAQRGLPGLQRHLLHRRTRTPHRRDLRPTRVRPDRVPATQRLGRRRPRRHRSGVRRRRAATHARSDGHAARRPAHRPADRRSAVRQGDDRRELVHLRRTVRSHRQPQARRHCHPGDVRGRDRVRVDYAGHSADRGGCAYFTPGPGHCPGGGHRCRRL